MMRSSSVSAFRVSPLERVRFPARALQVLRDLLVVAVVLAIWFALWSRAASTVTEPWGPDPETRAAVLQERNAQVQSAQVQRPSR
jgi:hypothetical protein